MNDEQQSEDERALAALLAALVQDSPASQVSPAEIIELARDEKRAVLDQRIKRLKLGRNVLLAAALVAVVALVLPHLGNSSSSTAASSSSSSSAADAAAAPVRAPGTAGAGAGSSAVSASGVPQAASGAVSGAAAVPGLNPPVGGTAMSAPAAAAAASSAAPARSSAAAGAAAPPPVPTASGSSAARCPLLPATAIAAIRTTFPAGHFGVAGPAADCDRYGVTLRPGAQKAAALTVLVSSSAVGGCRGSELLPCSPVAGEHGAYQGRTTAGADFVAVYGNGYQVLLEPGGSLSTRQLITTGRAVLEVLG